MFCAFVFPSYAKYKAKNCSCIRFCFEHKQNCGIFDLSKASDRRMIMTLQNGIHKFM